VGNCTFCGQSAGFFQHEHAACRQRQENGREKILSLIAQASQYPKLMQDLSGQTSRIGADSFVSAAEQKLLLAQGWARSLDSLRENDGLISAEAERSLLELQRCLALSRQELDQNGAYTRLVKAVVIRELLAGILPARFNSAGLSFNLQKDESIIWAFPNVHYLEDRVRRQYVGGSHGVSVRVAKGMYYRVGAFKGQAIDRTQRVQVDTGILAITSKNVYFAGPAKSLRVSYTKIVSFQPFSDGFAMTRDAVSAKPQVFITGDGWFSYNLVTNLAHLAR
jgi:hypothetical protein